MGFNGKPHQYMGLWCIWTSKDAHLAYRTTEGSHEGNTLTRIPPGQDTGLLPRPWAWVLYPVFCSRDCFLAIGAIAGYHGSFQSPSSKARLRFSLQGKITDNRATLVI